MNAIKSARGAPRPLGRPRSKQADCAILQSALALFGERGFDNISIDDIAARAGVARTTVYRRWTSKAALLAEAIASQRGAPELDPEMHDAAPELLLEAIAKVLTAPGMKRIIARLIGASGDHPELMEAYWRTHMEPRRMAVLDFLIAARASGRIPPEANVSVVLDIIAGAVTYQVLVRPGDRSPRELKSHLMEILRELRIIQTSPPKTNFRSENRERIRR